MIKIQENGKVPCVFTVHSAFVGLDVALGQYLVAHGLCNELAHQLEKENKV